MGVQATPAPAPSEPSAASGQPGANAPTAGTDPTPSSSPAAEEQASRGPDYFRDAFARIRSYRHGGQDPAPQAPPASRNGGSEAERPGTPAPKPSAPAATTLPARSPAAVPSSQPPGSPTAITLTPEELDRRIQSETDRRRAKERADAEARAQREEEQRLRREDPFEYVRLLEAREAEQQQREVEAKSAVSLLEQQLHHYDRGILDPIVGALPEPTRKKILTSVNAEGIPGRQEVARQSLAALRTLWNAEGRETAKTALMKDEKFIKEVLARYGGQRTEGPPEVTAGLPPTSSSRPVTPNEQVNGWMRSAGSAIRSTSR
jgi:hypothetical protein